MASGFLHTHARGQLKRGRKLKCGVKAQITSAGHGQCQARNIRRASKLENHSNRGAQHLPSYAVLNSSVLSLRAVKLPEHQHASQNDEYTALSSCSMRKLIVCLTFVHQIQTRILHVSSNNTSRALR
jgi:hypothetical protein